jgi:hypothetical protein
LTKQAHESLRVFKELDSILNTGAEKSVELVTAPLDAVLDLVREVSEGAHGDRLLRRILRVTIGCGLVRHNHLGVCFGSKSTRLKKRLLIPNALTINIETSFDVIDSIDDEIETLPEFVVESIFRLRGYESLVGCNLELWVHDLGFSTGSHCFRATNIWLSEKELTVKVGNLNVIIVSDSD